MSSSSIRNIIILAFISLSGIITTQIFWVKKALDLKEDQFNYKTLIALRSVANRLVEASPGASELRNINKKSDLSYVMIFQSPVHVKDIEIFFIKEFKNQNINPDFKYSLKSQNGDTSYYSNIIDYKEYAKPQQLTVSLPNISRINVEFFLKRTFLRDDDIKLLTFFSGVLLIVLGFFSYTIYAIMKQKQLNEVKNDFVNNMTHEFKTPISTIALSSDVLMKDDIIFKPDRLKHYATIIHEENKRLKTQVESVLQVSLIESHKLKLNMKPIDLHELISNIARNFEPRVAELNGAIILSLKAEKSVVTGDEIHLQNIFFNLFDNAIKYAGDKVPEIEVSTENKANGIEIVVKDNGKGIPKEAQKMIFEKFYRVPSGNVHDVKGFGLGLFYVKNMVKLHKGRIELSSTPKVGTTFTLWFEIKKS